MGRCSDPSSHLDVARSGRVTQDGHHGGHARFGPERERDGSLGLVWAGANHPEKNDSEADTILNGIMCG